MKLVGLSGYARAGKDSVGTALAEIGFRQAAFADALREMALALDPLIDLSAHPLDEGDDRERYTIRLSKLVEQRGWEGAKEFADERRLLQRLGTDAGRLVLGTDVWVRAMHDRVTEAGGGWVITDVRFPNEAAWVKSQGGQLWRVVRPGCVPVNDHVSEWAHEGFAFDHVITNDGSLDELKATAWRLVGWQPTGP